MKIYNHTGGAKNDLVHYDPCPKCKDDVTDFTFNYDVSGSAWFWDNATVTTTGGYVTFGPCGCVVPSNDTDLLGDWKVRRFPKDREGKRRYNATVRCEALAYLGKISTVPHSHCVQLRSGSTDS